MIHRKISLFSAFFIVFLLSGLFLSGQVAPRLYREVPDLTFVQTLQGRFTEVFEKKFSSSAPAYEPSRTFWGVLEYELFEQGRAGVVLGADQRLFTAEEFSWPKGAEARIQSNVDYVKKVQAALSGKNIALQIVLVPAKARMAGFDMPLPRSALYDLILSSLIPQGIRVTDLRPVLRTDKAYLRTDTHWSPEGAALAAEQVVKDVKDLARVRDISLGKSKFSMRETGGEPYEGDLLRYIPLGTFSSRGPAPDHLKTYELTGDSAAGGGLFDDVALPVTLVGTSYSADERWHFADFLKSGLQTDLLNAADPGQGPFATMKAYLDSAAFKETPPELIVWEMPERYFPLPPQ